MVVDCHTVQESTVSYSTQTERWVSTSTSMASLTTTEYTMPSTSNTIASVTTTANSHESAEDNIKLSSHGTYEPLYNNLLITRKALCMTRLLQ